MAFNEREYQTVVLGALLHDIGKMLQRGSFGSLDMKGQHPRVSSDFVSAFKDFFSGWVDFGLLKTLVQNHHEDSRYFKEELLCRAAPDNHRALSYLVSRADNYSSSERGSKSEFYHDFKSTPMASVFGRIQLDREPSALQRYRLSPLSPEAAFPDAFEAYGVNEVNSHLQEFGEEFRKFVVEFKRNDFDAGFTNIMAILMQYSWCIPSNTQEDVPDVSLFDHLKTTCAIAACLYHYHAHDFEESKIRDDETKKFILLVGDLSGIQNYLFNISHIGAGGIAKRLRARSFQLNLLSEILSHKTLHAFGLPLANILMSSGGKFYILLPNTESAEDTIGRLKREADLWFYRNFNSEINVNIATTAFSGSDFGDYGNVLKRINRNLQYVKKTPFSSIMAENAMWSEGLAVIDVEFSSEEKLCKACNKFPGTEREDGKAICDRCSYDKEIGQELPRATCIAFYQSSNTGRFENFLGYSFDLLKNSENRRKDAYLLVGIDNPIKNANIPVAQRFIANYVPTFQGSEDCSTCRSEVCKDRNFVAVGQPRMFECIAGRSKGKKMLGYFKADVDNLGAVFAFGLKESNTVSRVSTLSRMLDIFFSGYVQTIIRKEYPDLYTVYSGGDDLLVIGPWNTIIDFSEHLNGRFREFTCNNRNLTLSAGIALVKHGYPVFRSVEIADNALDTSKGEGKDRLTLFSQTIEWGDLLEVMVECRKLETWIEQKQVSSGFAMNLLTYSEMIHNYNLTGETKYLRFLPLMTYDIARNLPYTNSPDLEKRKIRLWAEQLKDFRGHKLKHLGIIANYALTANSGGKNE